MCPKEEFVIDFEEIRESDETFSFKLDSAYFIATESDEIRDGEIETTVKVSRKNGCFKVAFLSKGHVTVDCSRCLDPMQLPIDTYDELLVKLGEEYLDEGDVMIIIPKTDQRFDTFWHIYEFIALAIPAQHSHDEGQCNQQMMQRLNGFNNPDNPDDSDNTDADSSIDPRWAKLQNLLNDNK